MDQMQLEIGASGAAQSENTLDQIKEQVITDGIRLSMSQEPALSINSIGIAAMSPSLAQCLLSLPLAHLFPCQTQDLLLRHQLWLIPPARRSQVRIAQSLNLATSQRE